MTNEPILHDTLWPPHSYDAAGDVAALCDTVRHMAMIAAALAENGRQVDVTGLDHTVGLLCAKALDLPPAEGRTARIGLITALAEIDALGVALRPDDLS